jgi:broad specificity phosphatase PhoE
MNTIYIVRHAEYENNISKKININPLNNKKLTSNGTKQAKKVALELKDIKFERVLVSEFLRTQETAKQITNVKQETNNILNELKIGRENSNYENHNKKVKAQIFKSKIENNDESIFEKLEELKKFFKKIKQTKSKNTLIVTHKDTIRLFMIINEKLSIEEFYELDPKNCSIYKIEY